MKDVLVKVLKSSWLYVILLAFVCLFTGGAYLDQVMQMIR